MQIVMVGATCTDGWKSLKMQVLPSKTTTGNVSCRYTHTPSHNIYFRKSWVLLKCPSAEDSLWTLPTGDIMKLLQRKWA